MNKQQGMSLVGLMVGIFVGLLVALAVAGTASFMESQRRMSTGANGAMSNAANGMFLIEKVVRQAGLGLMVPGGFACPGLNLANGGTVRSDGGAVYPVSVVDGGTGPDQITIAYLDTLLSAAPPRLLLPQATADSAFRIANSDGIVSGTLLLLQDASALQPCTLMQVSAVTAAAVGADIVHTGGPTNTASSSFSTPVAYLDNAKAAPANAFRWLTYRVNTSPASPNYLALEEVDNSTGAVTVVAEDVVSMQAQYGLVPPLGSVAAPLDSVISWTDATGAWAAPSATDMLRVRAVRLAIVARSQDRDHTAANACSATSANQSATRYRNLVAWTGKAPAVDPSAANPEQDGPTIDLATAAGDNWCHYRYRSVNLMLPLLNVRMGLR